jgi:hypothetical protein
MKSQYHLAPWDCGFGFRRLPSHRVDEMALLLRIKSTNQETGRAIDLFRRTALAGISIGIDDLTFA